MIQRVLVDYKLKMGQEYDLILKKASTGLGCDNRENEVEIPREIQFFFFFFRSKDNQRMRKIKPQLKGEVIREKNEGWTIFAYINQPRGKMCQGGKQRAGIVSDTWNVMKLGEVRFKRQWRCLILGETGQERG